MTSTPIKCLAIGDGCVGKTCLLRSYVNKSYFSAPVTTTYEEYLTQASASENNRVNLLLCDTTGMEAYDYIRPIHYTNTEVILLCFSVMEPSSMDNIHERWLPEIHHYCPNVPILLVGTKIDLREENPPYVERKRNKFSTHKQGLALAKDINALSYLECSALKGDGVSLVFDSAAACGIMTRSQQSDMSQRESKCAIL